MKQKIIAVVFLLAAATTGLSFALIAPLNSVNASSQQDCEAATSDCTGQNKGTIAEKPIQIMKQDGTNV